MGYPYGYPYPSNPAVGSSSMSYGSIKQAYGSFQVPIQQHLPQQQHQQQQQQRQSSLSHSTSTTFPPIASGSLGIFQDMGECVSEEGHHPESQSLLMRGEDKDGDGQGQGQGMSPHGPLS
ncbi:hypothetical protein BGZ95_003707 [Linnemannia exigua]|uniref:Uncharacterized protein n=1 Tax=Linnemannia exigua TaxID=604196 RepID=A0AAD4D3W6_9FUNG|nr:hypothetical protein BGZ95_003707 [Linnemannia exigua]